MRAAKTGTAQKVKDGRYSAARIGSLMGFVPADEPKLAIVVVVDEPTVGSRYGGTVAGPAWAEIAGGSLRHLGITPDPTLLPEDERPELDAPVQEPGALRLSWSGEGWTLPETNWDLQLSKTSMYALGCLALFLIQIPFLKRYLEQRV